MNFHSWAQLDMKIEIPLPNEYSRMEVLKNIHAAGIAKLGKIDHEALVKLAELRVNNL
ncbi:hypothetical protein DM860_012256 [Cuscuta australis]|uniref:Uncharacterized protein n=1 Tax=Cuscuta australis TaxID=267555 RepID=A0A328EAT9_9ASTE|nr:hypothetical protein DM860_012256 [Cuscuta australis]